MKPESKNFSIGEMFGRFRAEWQGDELTEVFQEPSYYKDLLVDRRPCFIFGGRGTGKTTVLKNLETTCFDFSGSGEKQPFYGCYMRINTSHVTAFKGPEVGDDKWVRIFGHYFTLTLAGLLANFAKNVEKISLNPVGINSQAAAKLARSLGATSVPNSIDSLVHLIENSLAEIECDLDQISDGVEFKIPLLGRLLEYTFESLKNNTWLGSTCVAFLIDEYENLLPYQQRVVNTLIKHVPANYTFRVGVKHLGIHDKLTLNRNEFLSHPADYVKIDIEEKILSSQYEIFATKICNNRLRMVSGCESADVREMFPALSEEDEANLFDAQSNIIREEKKVSKFVLSNSEYQKWSSLKKTVVLGYAESKGIEFESAIKYMLSKPNVLKDRYNNYAYSTLFKLGRKKKIPKHYSGWRTILLLANGNIRFLLEIVHNAISLHLESDGVLGVPISPEHQTLSAYNVGKTYLFELEGASLQGANLVKLALSVGRIFEVLAKDSVTHAPEVNQFVVSVDKDSPKDRSKSEEILRSGIMHMALQRSTGNKLQSSVEIRDYDYRLHPIFSPFFCFSHRRKRKIELRDTDIIGLVEDHRNFISSILSRMKVDKASEKEIAPQLSLFSEYFI